MKQLQDSLNTAVFTTSYVVNKNSPILFVYHGEDGSWQSHGPEENVDDENIRLVALGEIINIDTSVLEIADMPIGFEAVRNSKDSGWIVKSSN